MKQLNLLLGIAVFILLMLNFYGISELNLDASRWIRIISSLSFFIFFLFVSRNRSKYLFLTFIILALTDWLILKFELSFIRQIFIGLMIIAYSSLLFYLWPFIKGIKAGAFYKVVTGFIILLNTLLIVLVMELAGNQIDGLWHSTLFFLYGIAILVLIVFAYLFNDRYSNTASFLFICAMFGLVLSDISGFIAHYVKVQEFYYPDRMFYLLGLACLVKHCSLEKPLSELPNPENV